MQLAPSGDRKRVGRVRILYAQGDVPLELAVQPLPQLPPGHELPFATREWRVIDQHVHRDRRLFDRDARQPIEMVWRGHRLAYFDTGQAGNGDDLSRCRRLKLDALESLEREQLDEACLLEAALTDRAGRSDRQQRHRVTDMHLTPLDPANANASKIGRVVER